MQTDAARGRLAARRLVHGLLPHDRKADLRRFYNFATWWIYAGRGVSCNCCDRQFRRFRAWTYHDGHRGLMCPRCGSLGRLRVDWLYLTEHTDLQERRQRLLHIAPEVALQIPLRRLPELQYLSADYDSKLAMEQMDVTDISYSDGSFDAIICNHVLQHVDDDEKAMRELFRVLAPGGWALIQSPVDRSLAQTVETAGRAGHGDPMLAKSDDVHLRSYGTDYVARLERAGFHVTVSDFARTRSAEEQHRLGLDPQETVYFCRKP
jgi:SAM-dependent methyltransferase